ncbi:RNA polymerase sigma factor [Microbacterium lacticum]|uniref:RNA polymerase sigma factor n=1 Tax=Microbacterium lacticum TaxID=33885 RepID=UPI003211A1F1
MSTDNEVIERSADEPGAFALLFDRHAPAIYRYAAQRLGLDAARLTRRLASALRGLPASDRDTLLLYAWGDLDYAGIARALDVPIGTVRSRLNRARRILRTAAGTNDPELEKEHGRVDAAAQHA